MTLPKQLVSVIALAAGLTLLPGCPRKPTGEPSGKPMANETSTAKLLEKLPNLKAFDVESCSYAIEKSSSASGVPSPSDIRMELKGSAVLSERGSRTLRSNFTWAPLARDRIPPTLLATLPPGKPLVSGGLADTFSNNPTYAHGFVVMLDDGDRKRIYFLATDMDHPIK